MINMNFHSITFKAVTHIFTFSILFILFITFFAKNIFSDAYMSLEEEKVAIITTNISPSLALNMSYSFDEAVDEILTTTLKNKNVLLLQLENFETKTTKIFSDDTLGIKEYYNKKEILIKEELYDPATQQKLGKLTLVYSNDDYDAYMDDFNRWFFLGIVSFFISIMILAYLLFKSLKNLSILDKSLKSFNPNKPKKLSLNITNNDEVSSISKSANIMIDNIINFINSAQNLNRQLTQSQNHLKDAQRMAKVGSWEYNPQTHVLNLSDEYYRILGIKLNKTITWSDFLDYIDKEDYLRVTSLINKAVEKGSYFDVNYTINLTNSKQIYLQTNAKVRKKSDGSVTITGISMDITTDVQNKRIIEKLAYFDPLTELANRTLLQDRMFKALQNAKRDNDKLAVIFLDLDHFKLINDTLGHSVGDELLIHVSNILQNLIRESDTLSRLGGDEFVILLPAITDSEDIHNIASKIQKTLQIKHDIGSHQLYATSSIGVAIYPEHGKTSDELIRNADTAMYEAKSDGRNRYKIYSQTMGNYIDKQLHLEQDLVDAVNSKDQIEVFYQPKIDTITKKISGAEALVRWRHPTKGLVFPDDFIYMAESTGLMVELGNIITQQAIIQLKRWNDAGFIGLKMAINLSARQFQDDTLVSFVDSMLKKYAIDPTQIEFEITESISMSNMQATLRILTNLKELGVSIAIDDFGTGHSSLAYLKKFPIDTLKIDKSFVMGITDDDEDKVIAQTIISMAHSLGMKTVAEGVETLPHVKELENMGCDLLQGYFYSKPIPKNDFVEFLQNFSQEEK